MEKTFSFTAIEKELSHGFRNKVNGAETVNDLRNLFSHTMIALVKKALPETTVIDFGTVGFDPLSEGLVKIDTRLMQKKEFQNLLDHSDLKRVMERFAKSINRRYLHLQKHSEKTNLKIRK